MLDGFIGYPASWRGTNRIVRVFDFPLPILRQPARKRGTLLQTPQTTTVGLDWFLLPAELHLPLLSPTNSFWIYEDDRSGDRIVVDFRGRSTKSEVDSIMEIIHIFHLRYRNISKISKMIERINTDASSVRAKITLERSCERKKEIEIWLVVHG